MRLFFATVQPLGFKRTFLPIENLRAANFWTKLGFQYHPAIEPDTPMQPCMVSELSPHGPIQCGVGKWIAICNEYGGKLLDLIQIPGSSLLSCPAMQVVARPKRIPEKGRPIERRGLAS